MGQNSKSAIDEKTRALNWLRYEYKGHISELGGNVAWFLDKLWGLHNLNSTSRRKVDWSNDTWIEIVIDKPLCTVDSDGLTRLVVIAHQMMLRIEMRGCGPGYIKLTFHQRTSRNSADFYRWCPGISEHVDMITAHHPAIDAGTEVME